MPNHHQQGCSLKDREDVVLSWTVHLARENPIRLLTALIAIMSTVAFAYYVIGLAGAIAAAFMMLSALADFLFPVTFVLNSEGAEARMLLKKAAISWGNVKRYYLDNQGIKLSPLDRVTRIEAFRGVYLRFKDNKEEVIATVKSLRETHHGC